MADSSNSGSENKEVADQFSVWITRSKGTQTITVVLPSSPCRWTRARQTLLTFESPHRTACVTDEIFNLCYKGLRSSVDILILAPQRTQRITGSASVSNFLSSWLAIKIDNGIFKRPIMASCSSLSSGLAERIRKYFVFWETSVTVKHLIKKVSPVLLNFTKSTARSSEPSRKCRFKTTRVLVVCADKATWLFRKRWGQCSRMICLICFQCFLIWYISLKWYLLRCIVFIQCVAQIVNVPPQYHGVTTCQ